MPFLFLSVDLGNSRCKLRMWELDRDAAPRIADARDFDVGRDLAAEVRRWLAEARRASAAAVSSVASPAIEGELVDALRSAVDGAVQLHPESGIAIECREPGSVGRDRIYAARGAFELVRSSAIVVDAGTALTVDALRVDGTRRAFLGGAIAPGPRLLAAALANHTARLPRIEPRAGAAALGRDTEAALNSGIVVGFRGAARELVDRISEDAQLASSPVVLTGGARVFLAKPTAFGMRRVLEHPDVVHLGLLSACSPLLDRGARAR
jgi:type III pantothenate kinase